MSDPGADGSADVLAGEYVLGLLDAEAAGAVEARALRDPDLAAAIALWQARFEPLAELAAPVRPSEALWPRIAAGLSPAAAAPPATVPRVRSVPARASAWRGVALASMAVAAGLAAFIAWPRQAVEPAWSRGTALLSVPGSAAASLRAQVTRRGTITVVPLQHLDVPAGRSLGFWAWPATEKAPVLLGMMPASGGQMNFPYPAREGTPVMVTLEGSRVISGSKPGPTLYLGLLVPATE